MAVISLDDHLTVKASAASGLLYVRNVFAICVCILTYVSVHDFFSMEKVHFWTKSVGSVRRIRPRIRYSSYRRWDHKLLVTPCESIICESIIWREKSGERSRRTHFMGPAGCKGMLKTLANSYKTPSDTENKTKKNITQTLQTLCIFLQNFVFKTQGNSCWFVLSLVTTSHRNSKWSGTLISHEK